MRLFKRSPELPPPPPSPPPPSSLPASVLPFVQGASVTILTDTSAPAEGAGSEAFVYVPRVLQDVADYRGALRGWFARLAIGGRLALTVPHAVFANRSLTLPLRDQAAQRRLYTPSLLLGEVEEALDELDYSVRLLADDGIGGAGGASDTDGSASILLVIERLARASWTPDAGEVEAAAPPGYAFEPARTRIETVAKLPRRRIIALKLDHVGDFVMGTPALELLRRTFPDADITLVVGHWNEAAARDLGLFDTVVVFDAFPRNLSEDAIDLGARIGEFERLLPEAYDLAIDLRTEVDTRFLLRHLKATTRAGIGTRGRFDFLDIFLPVDVDHHAFEVATRIDVGHHVHLYAPSCRSGPYRIRYTPEGAHAANPYHPFLVFGPYWPLGAGEYIYEPHLEIEGSEQSRLILDVTCGMKQAAHGFATPGTMPHLQFRIDEPDTPFEFRIAQAPEGEIPPFSFFGGRLLRRGARSVLHQAEYLALLVELVALRADRLGTLRESAMPS